MSRCAPYSVAAVAFACAAMLSAEARAATIWTGPDLSFARAEFADPTQAANQDRITDNVWIARGDDRGIFNAKTEAAYIGGSPADTEWAWDLAGFNTGLNITATNFANLTFNPWATAFGGSAGGGPPATSGIPGVLHLISDDIYLNIEFTSWSSAQVGGGGGFSYVRSTPEPTSAMLAVLSALLLPTARRPRHG